MGIFFERILSRDNDNQLSKTQQMIFSSSRLIIAGTKKTTELIPHLSSS